MATTVTRHVSDRHRFELVTSDPDPRLRDHVRGYQDFRERTAAPLARRELASPDVVVIVDLDAGWHVGDGDGEHLRSFAGGAADAPTTVGHDGSARAVQVDLTPAGARALLGVPPGELGRTVVRLEDLLGPDAARLAEQLHDAPSSAARFALLDRLLLDRAASSPGLRPDVAWAWGRLVQSGGTARIDALARELGCSRRHLSAGFGDEIGLPPKAYARILRFRRAVDALLRGGETRLAEVAADCGYADQSHLNREFRALAGVTPTELLARRLPPTESLAA